MIAERTEISCNFNIHPSWLNCYYHGSCGKPLASRTLHPISAKSYETSVSNTDRLYWEQLDYQVKEFSPKRETALSYLAKNLSTEEQALLSNRLRSLLKERAAEDVLAATKRTWERAGLFQEEISRPLSLLLLQRERQLAELRSKTFILGELPSGSFSVSTELSIGLEALPVAKKIAALLVKIDPQRTVFIANDNQGQPTMQINRIYTKEEYLPSCQKDLEDISRDICLDLLLRVLAKDYTRNYWLPDSQ